MTHFCKAQQCVTVLRGILKQRIFLSQDFQKCSISISKCLSGKGNPVSRGKERRPDYHTRYRSVIEEKSYEQRKLDGLSEDWDLIYERKAGTFRSLSGLLVPTGCLTMYFTTRHIYLGVSSMLESEYLGISSILESEHIKVGLIYLYLTITAYIMFYASGIAPTHVYYNRVTDKYLCIWSSRFPSVKNTTVEFDRKDITVRKSLARWAAKEFMNNLEVYSIKGYKATFSDDSFFTEFHRDIMLHAVENVNSSDGNKI